MADVAADLRRALPGLRSSSDEADRVAYSRDLWPRHHMAVRAGRPAEHRPGSIVWPETTEEVAGVVRWAKEHGVPLVPFGAGSGVCGGVSPQKDVVVVDLKRLARIRAIDADAPFVDVESGYMGVPFEEALGRAGLTLGHFPSSILCSTVGGWIAARSAGQCSGAYGKIEDMVVSLECVTGAGDVVELRRRRSGPDLVPLVVGSEGTFALVTSSRLRLHRTPAARAFGGWSFPTTRDGWEAMRAMFQAGLRPAVSRLYDPFDAMLAKQGGVRGKRDGSSAKRKSAAGPGLGDDPREPRKGTASRSFRGAALRAVLRRPGAINELLHTRTAARALGGAMLVVIFEGATEDAADGLAQARRLCESMGGVWEGEGPARRWLAHRYSVSYRQAPVFANGAFVDTMEVAARWSCLGALYDGVRRALGEHVFVMAHFSHAYPDGCCIYFSFVGTADPGLVRTMGWDAACEATYDRAWKAALVAAVEAGGTLAHHHGVGRSKAPRLPAEMGAGVDVVRDLMRAFDPAGILNPGNLVPPAGESAPVALIARPTTDLDRESLLCCVEGTEDVASAERRLLDEGLTLDAKVPSSPLSLADWLARGAPGTRDPWLDPADQLLAGLDATLHGGRAISIRPAPRRAVGPDLTALLVGAGGRFGRIDRAWMRVHRKEVPRPATPFEHDRDPAVSEGERELLEAMSKALKSAP
jgi:alkyldihydroxyacetonephosphate synthase